MQFPLTTKILRPEHCDPLYLLRELGQQHKYCALLESADRDHAINDCSFLALGARDIVTFHDGAYTGSQYIADGNAADPLVGFESLINPGQSSSLLTMGYIGFISYESVRYFDSIDLKPDPTVPDAQFILPEVLLRIDHKQREVTIVAHEDTAVDLSAIEQVVLASPFFDDEKQRLDSLKLAPLPSLEDIEPYRQVTREQHCQAVRAVQEGILDGETFQVVLSQELQMEATVDPIDTYAALRAINPSPYMYYFDTPDRVIVGASPETLIRVNDNEMLYRPIAGTRKRTGDPDIDAAMQAELLADEKERCEHQMLVDLGRNDVGRVAEIGSVEVHDPFHIERYSHVFHIVSDVTARLRADLTALDAVRSTFPAGTLTGAPKLRAMEVIAQQEVSPRGIYGGAFGYIDLSGNVDFAILIRTLLFQDQKIRLRVGGGIVKDSVPEYEDNECLHKARSCLAAVMLSSSRSS